MDSASSSVVDVPAVVFDGDEPGQRHREIIVARRLHLPDLVADVEVLGKAVAGRQVAGNVGHADGRADAGVPFDFAPHPLPVVDLRRADEVVAVDVALERVPAGADGVGRQLGDGPVLAADAGPQHHQHPRVRHRALDVADAHRHRVDPQVHVVAVGRDQDGALLPLLPDDRVRPRHQVGIGRVRHHHRSHRQQQSLRRDPPRNQRIRKAPHHR